MFCRVPLCFYLLVFIVSRIGSMHCLYLAFTFCYTPRSYYFIYIFYNTRTYKNIYKIIYLKFNNKLYNLI